MAAKPQICVIGLGKFGYKVGASLIHLNHQVIGIDSNPTNVQRAQKIFHQVYEADISNKQALEQIGFREITHALISVGGFYMQTAMHFYVLAFMVGTVQGGSQALSRSLYGIMVPKKIHNLICPGRAVSVERQVLGPMRVMARVSRLTWAPVWQQATSKRCDSSRSSQS